MKVYPLSTIPEEAANMLCDQHLRWIPKHINCILHSALKRRGAEYITAPKNLQPNNAWAIWASESLDNFWWLAEMGKFVCKEYSIRYSKWGHPNEYDIDYAWQKARMLEDWEGGFTPFPQLMPEEYKSENSNYHQNEHQNEHQKELCCVCR